MLHETNDHGGLISVDARHLIISLLLPSVRKKERVDASHARHIRAIGGQKNARMVFDGTAVDGVEQTADLGNHPALLDEHVVFDTVLDHALEQGDVQEVGLVFVS